MGRWLKASTALVACAAALFGGAAAFAHTEPSCAVTYAITADGAVTVAHVHCDTRELEPAAAVFALARVQGAFAATLAAQAPLEIEFTFSESAIRTNANGAAGGI